MEITDNEKLISAVTKFFNMYKSIPLESFRNSITYESLVDENFIGKIHSDEFPMAAKMSFVRRSESTNHEYVGFYPVLFYETQTVGMSARYYNIQKSVYKDIKPAGSVDEFIGYLEKMNNEKEKEIYDYIVYSLKVESGFLMTYQEAYDNFNESLKNYPKLPLMKCMDDAEYLRTKLEIVVDYINNPYVFGGIVAEIYTLSEENGSIGKHYVQVTPDLLSMYCGYEPINKTKIKNALQVIKKSIEKKRAFEDKILEMVNSI